MPSDNDKGRNKSAGQERRSRAQPVALAAAACVVLAVAAWALQMRGVSGAKTGSHPHTNRLASETSPYLLQHAHNPVDWYPWGPEAFAKAKKENKPIFLSIGYSSCHWCHVMERESFEDEGIARLLNERFVAIKVDREQRPDVDEIYMSAVQMMTGGGGWPMSTFLTPDGKPFFGGTYFPREQFAGLLHKVHAAWTDPEQRTQMETLASRVAQAIGQVAARPPTPGSVSPALFAPALQKYLADFDAQNGGFGGAPKFPPAMRLALMLAEHGKNPDPDLLRAVTLTLDHMARGGLYDQIGGGFHRYSTDEKWLVPHFEKMLYDNALLAWAYLLAYRDTQNPLNRRTATGTLDFVLRELRDPHGGFWSTLDADSEGEEGKFYVWTPKEVLAALGTTDGGLFNRIYDITPKGNFEGRSIPNLLERPIEARAKELKTTPQALQARLDALRARLLQARETRVRPPLDDKVLANWNGLMIRALALGYDVTGETRYREAAEQAANFLLTRMRGTDGRLRHSYRNGKTQPQAFLEDYSFLVAGLLELHEATGNIRWLREAQALARVMVADFWDEKAGTFFSTPHTHETLLARPASAEDDATPSGQSMAALALVRLAQATGDVDLRAKARRILETYAAPMKAYPAALPNMLLAAHRYFTPVEKAAQKAERVRVTLEDAPLSARPGEAFEATVRFVIPPGWHINAEKPADPALIATTVELAAGPFMLVSAGYPPAKTVRLGFSDTPLRVYEGETRVRLKLKALPGATIKALRLRARYQACSDKVCERPVEALLTAKGKTE